jgi:muramoyltetrapeptide carboxypeptidase
MTETPRKPAALRAGDTIAVVSPAAGAAAVFPDRLRRAMWVLERRLGLRPVLMPNATKRAGWVSASIEDRVADLHAAFSDPAIDGIVCTIGGYHSAQLLERLDMELIAAHPKVFCGYSDITCLHHALRRCAGFVTFYGPAMLPDFGEWPEPDEFVLTQFRRAVMETEPLGELPTPATYMDEHLDWTLDGTRPRARRPAQPLLALRPGVAEGPLLAGCMPVGNLLLGTRWAPAYEGTILMLETPPDYTPADADRDIWHLRNAGALASVAGLVLGRPKGFDDQATRDLHRVVLNATEAYGYPVVANLDAGHTEPMLTLPIGVPARIEDARVTILEPGVMSAGS